MFCTISHYFGITGTTLLRKHEGTQTLIVTKFTSCQCLHHLRNVANCCTFTSWDRTYQQLIIVSACHNAKLLRWQLAATSAPHDEVSLQEAPFWMQSEHTHCHSSQNPECKHVYKTRYMHKSGNILQHDGKYQSDDCYQITTCTSGDTKHNCPRLQHRTASEQSNDYFPWLLQ
jgi:hypothetical protein